LVIFNSKIDVIFGETGKREKNKGKYIKKVRK